MRFLRSASSAAICSWRSTTGRCSRCRTSRTCCAARRPVRPRATPSCGSGRARSSTFASRPFRCVRAPAISSPRPLGSFPLPVGAGAPRRRPRDPATLHFFWLAVAFFGVFTFSFSGRLDRLDWGFYWGDAISMLLLPPLFLHFTPVFPERARRWTAGPVGRVIIPLAYVPGAMLGLAHVVALARGAGNAAASVSTLETLDRLEFLYLAGCLIAGLAALARALTEVRSITGRRQLRWIAWGTALGGTPFAIGYALPFAFGVNPT